MKKATIAVLLIACGVVIGFPVFSMTYYTMVRTSTPEFCASCHEIRPAYNSWKTSTHVNNAQGFVADCMDCHLPAPHDTFDFFYAKTAHGIKDIWVHFTEDMSQYDRAEQRRKAYRSFTNDQCRKCHRNLLNIPYNRGAMLAHRAVLYPREGYGKKCVDCHHRLVHVDRSFYAYKEARGPYRAPGIVFDSEGNVTYPTDWEGGTL